MVFPLLALPGTLAPLLLLAPHVCHYCGFELCFFHFCLPFPSSHCAVHEGLMDDTLASWALQAGTADKKDTTGSNESAIC